MVARAESVVGFFRRVKQPEKTFATRKESNKQKRWCPPPFGWLKVNVDAPIDEDT